MSVRGRLAPSPTGVLHLGNARSFLLAWLDVRSRGGRMVLRIEDLDGPRIRKGADAQAIFDLDWLGLDWDEGPYYQRERLGSYQAAFEMLVENGQVYPCVCSRKDIDVAASAPHEGVEGTVYPGTCRGRFQGVAEARAAGGREPSWRFAVEPGTTIAFEDRFAGRRRYRVDQDLGDFVVWKSTGEPAYQLAVVVDDVGQSITDVLRADDLLPSTARQILLYRAFDRKPPVFAHTPLVVGQDGLRLAKRHGDTSLAHFRREGVTPAALVGMLAAWSGLAEPGARLRPRELVAGFDLSRVPRSPVVATAPEC